MLKLIHGADFHLDAPFAALSPEQARVRRAEQRQLLSRLADLAETERADLVLLSGDLLDGGETYQETVEALSRTLGQMKVPVFIAPGNHDSYGPRSVYAGTAWPDNVHIFTSVQPEGVELPELGCVVHGAAFTTPQADRSPLMGFSVPRDGRVHLMALHGDVAGPVRPHRPGGHRRQRPDLSGPGPHPRLLRPAKGGRYLVGLPRLPRGKGL